MSLEHFHPFAGDHAIQSAVVVAEWADPGDSRHLTSDKLLRLQELAVPELSRLGLQHQEQLNVLEFKMVAGQSASQSSPAFGGFKVSRLTSGNEEKRSVVLSRENCIIQINDYTRWADAAPDIQAYLDVLLPLIGQYAPIKSLTLQFNDVFFWRANSADLILTEVFRRDTLWLPAHVFSAQSLWHSHHGYFCDQTSPCAFRQLDNVNVSRAVVESIDSVQALIAHCAILENAIWVRQPLVEGDAILSILSKFHADNKRILAELFSDEVLRSIKLLAS